MISLLTSLYALSAFLLALYTMGQALLLLRYWRARNTPIPNPKLPAFPSVTIQLPLYNEGAVASRLLDAIAQFDYPRRKLLIQVLDDSDDSSTQATARKLDSLKAQGFRVQRLRRNTRHGFKAGALSHGLRHSADEYIAIFDADFIPPPNFLRMTLPHLIDNPRIGFVQSRWTHLNANDNALTRAQKLSIDTHFIIEQTARNRSGWLTPFNGSGGLWRRQCIEDAGDWSADTLTEDLDLSFRAQIKGWQSLFLPRIEVPGEIPPQLAAYKQQQARWAMGNTQCLIKLARPIITAKLSLPQKIMAIQHLCQYLPQPLMLILLLLTPPLLLANALADLPLASLGLLGLTPPLMYLVGQMPLHHNRLPSLRAFPALLFIGTGISLNNSLAVLAALLGVKVGFRRTPKFAGDWTISPYALASDISIALEFLAMTYALWACWLARHIQPQLCPYLLIYALSFATVAAWGLREHHLLRQFRPLSARPPKAIPPRGTP